MKITTGEWGGLTLVTAATVFLAILSLRILLRGGKDNLNSFYSSTVGIIGSAIALLLFCIYLVFETIF
jgi:hypothetical protein